MLTPDKIREKSFQTAGRGAYRAEEVDNFLDDVTVSYEQMFKENGDLIKKISILAKKVEEYRADEESLKLALLNAQKLADKIVAEAKETAKNETDAVEAETSKMRTEANEIAEKLTSNAQKEAAEIVDSAKAEAEKIVAEANRQSDEILGNVNRKVTHESLVYEMIQKEASEFKSKLVAMYRDHINLINQLPELVDEQLAEEESAPVEETVADETENEAEVYVEDTAPVAIEFEDEDSIDTVDVTEEPEMVDISSSFEEDDDVVVAEDFSEEETVDEAKAEPKAFKLDFSKIDFADEVNDIVEAPVVQQEVVEETPAEDDDTSSISFKKFFKKK